MRPIENIFLLSQEQKNNICKRFPVGFSLMRYTDRNKYDRKKKQGSITIHYDPEKRQKKCLEPKKSNTAQIATDLTSLPQYIKAYEQHNKTKTYKPTYKPGQGKFRQAQKIKNILQKFRKHPKFGQFAHQINKLGYMTAFTDIQQENKNNMHTIDSFKDRCLALFTFIKSVTFAANMIELINEMIDDFLCYVEQAKKMQFQNNLNTIQKSIDKITRQISDIKQQGNCYFKKKKKNQKNFDEKELIYLSDLIRELPKAYLVGILQIIEEKPFTECTGNISFNLLDLKLKKQREIQYYVKKKLSNLYVSRMRKKQKKKLKMLQKQGNSQEKKQQVQINPVKQERGEIQLSPRNASPQNFPSTPFFNPKAQVANPLPTFQMINQSKNQKKQFFTGNIDNVSQNNEMSNLKLNEDNIFGDIFGDMSNNFKQQPIKQQKEKKNCQQQQMQFLVDPQFLGFNEQSFDRSNQPRVKEGNQQDLQKPMKPPSFSKKESKYEDDNFSAQFKMKSEFGGEQNRNPQGQIKIQFQFDGEISSDSSMISDDDDSDY